MNLIVVATLGTIVAALTVTVGASGFSVVRRSARWWTTAVALTTHAVLLATTPPGLILSNVAVLVTSVVLATLVASTARSRAALVALAVAASVVDIVSFSAGPTRWLLRSAQDQDWGVVNYLAVSLPVDDRIVPVVGVGDLLFVATFFLALRGLGAGWSGAMAAPVAGLLVALGVGLAAGGAWAIPFMAVTTVLYSYRLGSPPNRSDAADSGP